MFLQHLGKGGGEVVNKQSFSVQVHVVGCFQKISYIAMDPSSSQHV